MMLLISASYVSRITGMSHQCPANSFILQIGKWSLRKRKELFSTANQKKDFGPRRQ
jgi:hypothetical protein